MKKHLTNRFIDSIKPGTTPQEFADTGCPNLSLIVQPSGKMTWVWRGRIKGKVHKLTLGMYPVHSLDAARKWANDWTEKRDQGYDPVEEKAKEDAERLHREELSKKTCDWCFDRYMEHEGGNRKSAHEKRRLYDKDISPSIGAKSIFDITHDDLAKIVRAKNKYAPTTANHLVSLIKRWFKWSTTLGRDLTGLTIDPSLYLVKLSAVGKRKRVLSDYEIGVFFRACGENPTLFREVLIFILYTGLRRAEAFQLVWSELTELDVKGQMLIDGDRVKNGKDHLLTLPVEMITLLQERRRFTGNHVYVWPSNRTKPDANGDLVTVPISGWSKEMAALNYDCLVIARKEGKTIEPFTIHDLRRTLSTGLNALHDENDQPLVPANIVERVINHTLGGVAGVYNRYEYLAEKKAALRVWAEHLTEIRQSVNLPRFPVQSQEALAAE